MTGNQTITVSSALDFKAFLVTPRAISQVKTEQISISEIVGKVTMESL
jgi:hypothetical protein